MFAVQGPWSAAVEHGRDTLVNTVRLKRRLPVMGGSFSDDGFALHLSRTCLCSLTVAPISFPAAVSPGRVSFHGLSWNHTVLTHAAPHPYLAVLQSVPLCVVLVAVPLTCPEIQVWIQVALPLFFLARFVSVFVILFIA